MAKNVKIGADREMTNFYQFPKSIFYHDNSLEKDRKRKLEQNSYKERLENLQKQKTDIRNNLINLKSAFRRQSIKEDFKWIKLQEKYKVNLLYNTQATEIQRFVRGYMFRKKNPELLLAIQQGLHNTYLNDMLKFSTDALLIVPFTIPKILKIQSWVRGNRDRIYVQRRRDEFYAKYGHLLCKALGRLIRIRRQLQANSVLKDLKFEEYRRKRLEEIKENLEFLKVKSLWLKRRFNWVTVQKNFRKKRHLARNMRTIVPKFLIGQHNTTKLNVSRMLIRQPTLRSKDSDSSGETTPFIRRGSRYDVSHQTVAPRTFQKQGAIQSSTVETPAFDTQSGFSFSSLAQAIQHQTSEEPIEEHPVQNEVIEEHPVQNEVIEEQPIQNESPKQDKKQYFRKKLSILEERASTPDIKQAALARFVDSDKPTISSLAKRKEAIRFSVEPSRSYQNVSPEFRKTSVWISHPTNITLLTSPKTLPKTPLALQYKQMFLESSDVPKLTTSIPNLRQTQVRCSTTSPSYYRETMSSQQRKRNHFYEDNKKRNPRLNKFNFQNFMKSTESRTNYSVERGSSSQKIQKVKDYRSKTPNTPQPRPPVPVNAWGIISEKPPAPMRSFTPNSGYGTSSANTPPPNRNLTPTSGLGTTQANTPQPIRALTPDMANNSMGHMNPLSTISRLNQVAEISSKSEERLFPRFTKNLNMYYK